MERKTPRLSEEGWLRAQEMSRSVLNAAQTGWFPRRNVRFVFGTTPSALVKRHAATPPHLGGDC
jgi:hypothetical protein